MTSIYGCRRDDIKKGMQTRNSSLNTEIGLSFETGRKIPPSERKKLKPPWFICNVQLHHERRTLDVLTIPIPITNHGFFFKVVTNFLRAKEGQI